MRPVVKFYLQTQTWIGVLDLASEERLSDFLNSRSTYRAQNQDSFLSVTNVTIIPDNGAQESLADAYLNRSSILLAATEDGDLARGVGARIEPKLYPYVKKAPVSVILELPSYTLSGNLHCTDGQCLKDLLNKECNFLPLTDVTIKPHKNGTSWQGPFVAVNKGQVLSSKVQAS